MKLIDVIHRPPVPEPWVEGEKIPWNDPAFSRRMLKEHLTQAHDLASRRFEVIDRQVEWIHQKVLSGLPSQILDLGCGPGFYTGRLARLGHRCTGLDFSPASIAYAQKTAQAEQLECRYLQADITTADYGAGYDLAMLIFGEFNLFRPATARLILSKVYQALKDGGTLLLEPHTFEAIQRIGRQPPAWYTTPTGLFSEGPHLCLTECFWDADYNVATQRYFIVDAGTGDVTRHAASMQAYTSSEYRAVLEDGGFEAVTFYPSLENRTPESGEFMADFLAITARRSDS